MAPRRRCLSTRCRDVAAAAVLLSALCCSASSTTASEITADPTFGSLLPGIPVAGQAFTLTIYGENYDPIRDKIMFAPLGYTCGSQPPPAGKPGTVEEYAAVNNNPSGTQTSIRSPDTNGLEGFRIHEPGSWKMCICDYNGLRPVPTFEPEEEEARNISGTSTTTSTTTTTPELGCDLQERYWIELSNHVFTFNGPEFHNWTHTDSWLAGVAYRIRLKGVSSQSLRPEDRIRIVGSDVDCADPTRSKAMHPAVSSDLTDPSGPRSNVDSNQQYDQWNGIRISDVGNYNVCWCGTDVCASDADFPVRAAIIEVRGPAEPATVACTTGVTCTFSFYGMGFGREDRIKIINSGSDCGAVPTSSAAVQGGDGSWIRSSGTETENNFGSIVMGYSGTFQVCWCGEKHSDANGCTQNSDFNIFVGNIVVGGPVQGTIVYAPLGAPFDYSINGWGMSDVDRISIVDNDVLCASSRANVYSTGVSIVSSPQGYPPFYKVGPSVNNRTQITWRNIVLTKLAQYKVCWCARNFNNCATGADFALTLGLVVVQGPVNGTLMSEVPGRPFAFVVRSPLFQSALHENDRIRIVNSEIARGRCGNSGTGTHSTAVSDLSCYPQCEPTATNGGPALTEGNTTASWNPVLLTKSGTYDVCWCNDGNGGCDDDEEFNVQVGRIEVNGVITGETWHCVTGMECMVRVPLAGGTSEDDMIQIIETGAGLACGMAGQADGSSFSRGTRVNGRRVNVDGGQVVEFNTGEPRNPGVFQVCYCQGTHCQTPPFANLDFFQWPGRIIVSGISGQNDVRICYLRQSCSLPIRGQGLRNEDAAMLIDIGDECGQGNRAAMAGFTGEGYLNNDGDRVYIGSYGGTSNSGTERWDFPLGTPKRVGPYRLCYCSQTRTPTGACTSRAHFDLPAGQVFVRGTEYQMTTRCNQGEACTMLIRGQSFSQTDRLLLFPTVPGSNVTCGDPDPSSYAQWMTPILPLSIVPDVIVQDMYAATFTINNMAAPGNFMVCYCSQLPGSRKCLEPQAVGEDGMRIDTTLYSHQVGALEVIGAITQVAEILTDGLGNPTPLPATAWAASVRVNVFMSGTVITCAATSRKAPTGFVPRRSDLMNCTADVLTLNDRQRLMPRCWGLGSTPQAVSSPGWHQVHIPLEMTSEAASQTSQLHIWCYSSTMCTNDRCVMPPDEDGFVVGMTSGLSDTNGRWTATVTTDATVRVPMSSDYPVALDFARIKVVKATEDCSIARLIEGVGGLVCGESAYSKCDPAPKAYIAQSWGNRREFVWDKINLPKAGSYNVCYCDRHTGPSAIMWLKIGVLSASGPLYPGQGKYWGNPGVPFDLTVDGLGLTESDRLRAIPEGFACTEQVVGSGASAGGNSSDGTGSARRLPAGFDWRSGPPSFQNATAQRWEAQFSDMDTYTVCWCGGATRSCNSVTDFTVRLGTISIDIKRDCELTDWWTVGACSKKCGGGTMSLRRAIQRDATGGGAACPGTEGLQRTEECNMEPCELARVDAFATEPATLHEGVPFVVHVQGNAFDPDQDRILLVAAEAECGESQMHFGGASCANENSFAEHLICGDGQSSVRVSRAGSYRICVCDGSSAMITSADGSKNISVGSFGAVGMEGVGCANAANYLLGSERSGFIEVLAMANGGLGAEDGAGLSPGAIVAITGTVALSCMLMLALCTYAMWQHRVKKAAQEAAEAKRAEAEMMQQVQQEMAQKAAPLALGDKGEFGEPPGMDMAALAWYEAYYQHLGYPPGTAMQAFGQSAGMAALPAPQMPALQNYAPPPPQQPNPHDHSTRWAALQNGPAPPPQAPMPLPPPGPGAVGPPPTPPMQRPQSASGRRPKEEEKQRKSFGDLIKEAEKKKPDFTNLDLSPMPTPTATPRGPGDATPREEDESSGAFAIEDGSAQEFRPNSSGSGMRPGTGDSLRSDASLTFSDSTAGASRPSSGNQDAAPPAVAGDLGRLTPGMALSPVREQDEEEDGSDAATPGTKTPPNVTPRKLKEALTSKLGKYLTEDDEEEQALPPGTMPDDVDSPKAAAFGGLGSLADSVAAMAKGPPEDLLAETKAKKAEEERLAREAKGRAEEERLKRLATERQAEEERLNAEKEEKERLRKAEKEEKERSKAAEKEEKERLKAEAKKAKKEQKKREALDKAKKQAEERMARKKAEEEERKACEAEEKKREEERRAQTAEAERLAREAAEKKAEEERLDEARLAREAAEREAEEARLAREAAERKAEEEHRAREEERRAHKAEDERREREARARRAEEERLAREREAAEAAEAAAEAAAEREAAEAERRAEEWRLEQERQAREAREAAEAVEAAKLSAPAPLPPPPPSKSLGSKAKGFADLLKEKDAERGASKDAAPPPPPPGGPPQEAGSATSSPSSQGSRLRPQSALLGSRLRPGQHLLAPGPVLPPEPPARQEPPPPENSSLRSSAQAFGGPDLQEPPMPGAGGPPPSPGGAPPPPGGLPPPPPGGPPGGRGPGPTLDPNYEMDFESSNLSQLSMGRPGSPSLQNLAESLAQRNSPLGGSTGMNSDGSGDSPPRPWMGDAGMGNPNWPSGRPPRGPGMGGPSLSAGPAHEVDFESSNLSQMSNSHGSEGLPRRAKVSLGGLARSSHQAVAALGATGAPTPPSPSAKSKPKRAAIQTRSADPTYGAAPPPPGAPPGVPPSPSQGRASSRSPTSTGFAPF